MKLNFIFRYMLGILFCLCMMAPNVQIYMNRVDLMKNGLETTAIVTETYAGSRGLYPQAYVQYRVDGIWRENYLHLKYNSVQPGQVITILYDEDDPGKLTSKNREHATDTAGFLMLFSLWYITGFLILTGLGIYKTIQVIVRKDK